MVIIKPTAATNHHYCIENHQQPQPQEIFHRTQVVGGARHQVAYLLILKKCFVEGLQVMKQFVEDVDFDFTGRTEQVFSPPEPGNTLPDRRQKQQSRVPGPTRTRKAFCGKRSMKFLRIQGIARPITSVARRAIIPIVISQR